ncbi:MAG: ATPase [Betaproteobacteria bacterium HGW-Betaproteobacteria-9]|jgi:predicted ATPase with chaperone activity|nr:MAG: ATPase [Betaproteobacteria bacterium HGW-Betaproteobacteria-9]
MQELSLPGASPLLKAAVVDPFGDAVDVEGLPASFVTELALRHFARKGELKLFAVAQYLGLPVPVVDQLLGQMRSLALLEVPRRGTLEGDISFALTDAGHRMARMAFEKCQYVGPAPVPLADYVAQVKEQAQHQAPVRAERLQQVLKDVVLVPELLPTLGSAMNSGKAIYLHGDSGTGKTYLAEHLVHALDGHIWVPYALYVDGEVVQVFDPIVHKRVSLAPVPDRSLTRDLSADGRWVRSERPVVIAGGELTLDTLDLEYDPHSRLHTASPQLKANNGIFVVDDLGRQRVSPSELMNRWIVPLDRHVDYLTLNTGTRFAVPFDVRVIFASNWPPADLVDPAFARRLGYKIRIDALDADRYRSVVTQACASTGVPEDPAGVDYLIHTLHPRDGRPYYPCIPFDVISKIADHGRYLDQPARMTPEGLEWAWRTYFGGEERQGAAGIPTKNSGE